jgi:Zn-dependent oligopeptidase
LENSVAKSADRTTSRTPSPKPSAASKAATFLRLDPQLKAELNDLATAEGRHLVVVVSRFIKAGLALDRLHPQLLERLERQAATSGQDFGELVRDALAPQALPPGRRAAGATP